MMVTFVSQCEKKALKKTRRVLDAFANRIGDNTWQTVITKEGLQAAHKLLKKTASKSTAVSCHWIRSRARSELLWIVGKRHEFNEMGYVPVNSTQRNILHNEWKSDWTYISCIQIIATLAALLHDIGKSTIGFQTKLMAFTPYGDPYRHEWLSLKLFEWLIKDCETDEAWLQRFTNVEGHIAENLSDQSSMLEVITNNKEKSTMGTMPPLAQWIAWLIVTHHRLPPFGETYYNANQIKNLKSSGKYFKRDLAKFYQHIKTIDYWVKNPLLISGDKELPKNKQQEFWDFNQLVITSPVWQKALKRWSNKALQNTTLINLSQQASDKSTSISDPMLLHLSRLSLMIGDHNYSSLDSDDNRRVSGDDRYKQLAANTDRTTKQIKQSLDEHLLGVSRFTSEFTRVLPIISQELPTLKDHNSLAKDTDIKRFKWQNKAALLARKAQDDSLKHGFFGVNMASTGCGKTIGNARIMYALSEKQGARFTVALGLRVLTLQTGESFRKDLDLSNEQLAILVGGSAQKQLYEFNQSNGPENKLTGEKTTDIDNNAIWGSESADNFIEEIVDAEIDYSQYQELNLGTVIENPKARDLLFAPIVTCTVDHIIQASECKRGGGYIAPMLRLLSSDLILDEPDDFDQSDLPALNRLVHLAGMLGSRILLSSATLPPDLLEGLFKSYQSGRVIYNQNHGKKKPNVVCAWFDEQEKSSLKTSCANHSEFTNTHQKFIAKRAKYLKQQIIRRRAEVLPLTLTYTHEDHTQFFSELAKKLVKSSISLHNKHHVQKENQDKKISVGLIRIANIQNIVEIAQVINVLELADDNFHIHLTCYHAKQLLVLRNALETKLDRILKRDAKKPELIFSHAEIKDALAKSPAENHIFIVLATPVAEVGRDHDYDWAIVEPSSMRSIIQLAGRIWRHRPDKVAEDTNLLILQHNIRHLKKENIVFTKPGFESSEFPLETHNMNDLMTKEQLNRIDALPRIIKPQPLTPKNKLSDLEHAVMQNLMNNESLNFVNAYWDENTSANRAHIHLQILSPFRAGNTQEEWILIPNDKDFDVYAADQVKKQKLSGSTKHSKLINQKEIIFNNNAVSPWLLTDATTELNHLKTKYTGKSTRYLATYFSKVALEDNTHGWHFNEWLGFWRNK